MELKVEKGDLFTNLSEKKNIILLHSCNAKGAWGSGVAAIFHKKFPNAYLEYKNKKKVVGEGFIVSENGYRIGCLITSKSYGAFVDPPDKIALSTYAAIKKMLEDIPEMEIEIHSPKINAGLFKTPWQWTKKAIVKACEESDKKIKWVVWEL